MPRYLGHAPAASTQKAFAFDAAEQVWNGSAFVPWVDGNYATYKITTSKPVPGECHGTLPAGTRRWVLATDGLVAAHAANTNAVGFVDESAAGVGAVAVNHLTEDVDGDTMEVETAGGVGIDDVTIRAYVTSEWEADPATAAVRGETVTIADGTWREPLMLDAGVTYTIVFTAAGYTIPSTEVEL